MSSANFIDALSLSLGVKSADCKALLFAGSPGESLGEGWEQERQDKKFSLSSEKFSVHCH